MKADIHPQYHLNAVIKCANCGHEFKTGATQESIQIEICSKCHPFFTGKKVLIDTEGRVERFRKKMEGAQGKKKKIRKKKTLEERVNEEIADQLAREAIKEEAAKPKKAKPAPKKEEAKVEETKADETAEEKAE